jgi:hypothetical protein
VFRRLLLEDWHRTSSLLGWALFAFVFFVSAVRAYRLPRAEVRRLKSLPFEKESHE